LDDWLFHVFPSQPRKDSALGSGSQLMLSTDGVALAEELFHDMPGLARAMLAIARHEEVFWRVVASRRLGEHDTHGSLRSRRTGVRAAHWQKEITTGFQFPTKAGLSERQRVCKQCAGKVLCGHGREMTKVTKLVGEVVLARNIGRAIGSIPCHPDPRAGPANRRVGGMAHAGIARAASCCMTERISWPQRRGR
jgi:hypothetical protein